jgi:protein-S-isoprenylcysteine O-methyltransferase Ste14
MIVSLVLASLGIVLLAAMVSFEALRGRTRSPPPHAEDRRLEASLGQKLIDYWNRTPALLPKLR